MTVDSADYRDFVFCQGCTIITVSCPERKKMRVTMCLHREVNRSQTMLEEKELHIYQRQQRCWPTKCSQYSDFHWQEGRHLPKIGDTTNIQTDVWRTKTVGIKGNILFFAMERLSINKQCFPNVSVRKFKVSKGVQVSPGCVHEWGQDGARDRQVDQRGSCRNVVVVNKEPSWKGKALNLPVALRF